MRSIIRIKELVNKVIDPFQQIYGKIFGTD